jgi:hypothetical protein
MTETDDETREPEQQPPEPSADGTDSPSAADPPETAEREGTDDDPLEELDGQARNEVINVFNGQVTVKDGGTVGFYVGDGVRRAAGRVAQTEIAAIRRLFLEPAGYAQALRTLRHKHLLILVGDEGSGRAAASVMLADRLRDPGRPIIRFPPTRTLADLGKQKFKQGQSYILRDWIPTATGGTALTVYDAEHLAERLASEGAYLVITRLASTGPGAATGAFEERWTAPDPVELFDHCYALVDRLDGVHEALPELRARASQLGNARRIVQLAERLCDGAEHALLSVDDSVGREVAAWFDASPTRRAVRAAVALTFTCRAGDEPDDAPGVRQRGFELLFAQLEAAEAEYRGDTKPDDLKPPEDGEEFPQHRSRLMTDTKLADFTIDPPATAVVGVDHRPGFRTAAQRDLFMSELVRRYGDDLWTPVHAWLCKMVELPWISDTHLAIAYSAGRMARYSTKEVREAYLERWASGHAAERYCAVFTLWSMAAQEDLAPLALAQARDWVWGRGPERAMVAAIAFGGALGKRYPTEAMWWLWELAMRGQRISSYARVAMGNLLLIDAVSDDPSVARYLANKVRPLLLPGARPEQRRAALNVIVAVLSAPGADQKAPGVLKVLRESSAALGPIGELWSGILRSAPHRPAGVGILHSTLKALEQSTDGTDIAAQLGRQILPRLTETQRTQVERGLRTLDSPEQRRRGQAILRAFLNLTTPPPAGFEPAGEERSDPL